jgi:glycine betaine/proline transport system substrate-binding protein
MYKWLLLTVVVTLIATACTTAPDEISPSTPEKVTVSKPVIKLAQRGWLGFELDNAVAKILLEEKMGYPVEIIDVQKDITFESLAKGETHANLEVWPSAWTDEIRSYIEVEETVEAGGLLGVVGKAGWFMPTYVLDEHPELATWEGFQDPANAALFSTAEAEDKGQFLDGDPDWAGYNEDIIRNLGLDLKVVHAGSEQALIAMVEEAYDRQDTVLFYFWTPHYLFAKLDLTEIKLPEYNNVCYDKAESGGIDCDYPADPLTKALWPGLKDYAPEAYLFLKNFNYTTQDQIVMLALVEVQGETVEAAARTWIEQNENVWSRWIPQIEE